MRMTLDELINAMEPQARKDKALISKCVDGLTEYAAELRQKAGDAGKEQISALRRLVDELAGYWGLDAKTVDHVTAFDRKIQEVDQAVHQWTPILLGIIPCLLVLPMLAPVILFLGIAVYFKEIRRADERLGEKRGEVEAELPRFVATITQELAASRDVLSMVESYKRNAGQTFAAELDILTADMRSGSYEAALTRFEARFNSPLLSDIIRGLIGVLRGDNGVAYFQMLSHDMKQLELQRLKAQAMKIPPKIRVFSFLMLMCFLMTYLAIIVYEIITSLGGMF